MTEKNKSFLFGLTVGVAVIALAGWLITLVRTDKPSQIGNNTQRVMANDSSPAGAKNAPTGPADIKVTSADYLRGNPEAPVTIVEFSDLQCPYCAAFHQTMRQVISAYPDKVRWVYKHFPLDSIHPNARPAAEASECAAEQGKFWDFIDVIFVDQSSMSLAMYKKTAADLGLNTAQFNACVDLRQYKNKVEADYQLGVANGVRGTPGNFINGQAYSGALPLEQIQGIIDSL